MNETIEFAILNDGYKPTMEEVRGMARELWDIKFAKRGLDEK